MTIIDPSPRTDPDRSGSDVALDVRPLAGHIGAEIHGVDLSADLDDATVAAIRTVLLRWKVVFFRDQTITPAQQVAFGRRFGDVTPAHPTLPPLEGHPEVLPLDSRAYRSAGAGVSIESRWHTDVTFTPNPPFASILHGVIVPPYGGDTAWTNLVTAYEALSPALQAFLDGLRAVHRNTLYFTHPTEAADSLAQQFTSTSLSAVHPVVRVHPETGERVLFVNPNFTQYVVGLGSRESRALLDLLYEHLSQPEFTVRFRWEQGSVAFWDNRATAHLAPTDLRHLPFDRVMHRITLAGDVPVGVDGRPSEPIRGGIFA